MPRNLPWSLSQISLAITLLCAPAMPAATITDLVVFGDSVSDDGNALFAFQFLPSQVPPGAPAPVPPYYTLGRYTNGVDVTPYTSHQGVWVEQLAVLLGVAVPTAALPHVFVPALPSGTDYAVGGAQTGTGPGDMGFQVSTFLSQNQGGISPNSLYVLFGGANDLYVSPEPLVAAAIALSNLRAEIGELTAAGARNFLFPNLPDLGRTPRGAAGGNAAALSAASLYFDQEWAALLAASRLQTNSGVKITGLDLYAEFQRVEANPGAFGLSNAATPALQNPYSNADGYLFWDGQHPTTAGHALIANSAFAALATPEPGTIALSFAGFACLVLLRRAKQSDNR